MKKKLFGGLFAWLLFNLILIIPILLSSLQAQASSNSSKVSLNVVNEKTESFSFVVWGHPTKRIDGTTPLHFEEILERISELGADFLIITGDNIHGMWGKPTDPKIVRADWDRLDEGLKKLGIPVYRVPGNHDVHNFATRDIYLERYEQPPFAFTYKGSRFVLLDTIGIAQQKEDVKLVWKPQQLPFSNEQLSFIHEQVQNQDRYKHLFFFMHHGPWRYDWYWWKDVHPMLKGSKTRAVFSGTPGGPGFKYDHLEQDNIHYILSCTFPTYSVEYYKKENERGELEGAMCYQPDNLQFVKVDGDNYSIRMIVVGALTSENLSSKFWAEVKKPLHWKEKFRKLLHGLYQSIRHLSLINIIWGVGGFTTGSLIVLFWQRRRSFKKAR